MNKAQGAIEYLLIIGVVILIVTVVIIALSGITSQGNDSVDPNQINSTKDPLKRDFADSMGQYYISTTTTYYFLYEGEEPITIGEIKKDSEGVNICLGNECEDDTIVEKDLVITVTGRGNIPKTDLSRQDSIEQEICDDGIDNDRDGKIDCLDLDCDTKNNCEYQTEKSCQDGIDNDGDGQTDCDDSDCYLEKTCAVFFEDFENGLTGWDIQNNGGDGTTWDLYTQSSGYEYGVGGSTIFNSNMLGVGERCAGARCGTWTEISQITSPQITLPQTPLTFEIDSWSNCEGGRPSECEWSYYDRKYLQISTDGVNWSLVDNCQWEGFYNESDATMRHFIADLSAYSGQTIQLRLMYDTYDDCCGPGEGWYVDNIWIHK